ncbi:TPA: hypothetical protein DEP94_02335 [Candidatus Nomurabacteria bacterium]|nr:hypothetical protein [Candidatus Nomurabacteria bacterium]
MYILLIKDLRIRAIHGLREKEKIVPQEFLINTEVLARFHKILAKKDIFDDSLCYGTMRKSIIKICTENRFDTLEALVYKVNTELIKQSEKIISITTSIEKTELLKDCHVGVKLITKK